MSQSIYVVDAFADRPFSGNPAAVCPMAKPADEQWMNQVAAEMNLSETAFLYPDADGWRLRWLTPTVEVKLCGHATLASAHVLWETGRADGELQFQTRSGLLVANRRNEFIELDFPACKPKECSAPADIVLALGVEPIYFGAAGEDYFVEVSDESVVRQLTPDHAVLAKLPVRGVIVTGRPTGSHGFDFVSRFFAPGSGIAEDPVTGSAHCALGPYWSSKLKKDDLVGFQASARGGIVRVGCRGERIKLAGKAITMLCGELLC